MRRLVVLLVAGIGALFLGAAPGHASDDALGLSFDGIHWTSSLQRPLFDPNVRWVPGDVRIARFYVRNQHPDRGDLTVDVERVAQDQLLDTGTLHIAARTNEEPWTSVSSGGLAELLDQDDLASGDPIRVEVRVGLDASSPNTNMVLATDLNFRVTITDADIVSDSGDQPGTDLPSTGSMVSPWMLLVAAALITFGALLICRRRDHTSPDALRGSSETDVPALSSS